MVDMISRDERYLFDLILKARRKAIALYLRFRKGQSVRDIWGSSAFPIVLSPNSAVQRLQCWSSSFRRSAAGISQSISTARSQTQRRGWCYRCGFEECHQRAAQRPVWTCYDVNLCGGKPVCERQEPRAA